MREVVSITASKFLGEPALWVAELLVGWAGVSELGSLLRVNRSWAELVQDDDAAMWGVLTRIAASEKSIYTSPSAKYASRRSCFEAVWGCVGLWSTTAPAAPQPETFNIRVCVRFRPENASNPDQPDPKTTGKSIVLPLHQRLEGIRVAHNLDTTAEAARVLMGTGLDTGDRFFEHAEVQVPDEAARARAQAKAAQEPKSMAEEAARRASVLDVSQSDATVLAMAPGIGMRAFKYDAAFTGDANQAQVYSEAGALPLTDFLNGKDACCIVFGQTGSGKTHTMFGDGGAPGIVPTASKELLDVLTARAGAINWSLGLSYVEVFGDEVTDLLDAGKKVNQSKTAASRWVLEGRAQHKVSSHEDIMELLAEGDAQKRRAATLINERSSRAHALFILSLEQEHLSTGVKVESTLVLADLGGSEDTKKSGAADAVEAPGMAEGDEAANWKAYYKKRERMLEAIHINKGLLALKNCVRALHRRQNGEPNLYVPYQDSKLTLLLSQVLGGKASTSILITGSPAAEHAIETVNTLRFGEDCRQITTTTSKIDATTRALQRAIKELDAEIKEAQEAVQKAERWSAKKMTRTRAAREGIDGNEVDEDTGVAHNPEDVGSEQDQYTVYRLEGADEESKRLEELLTRRRRLLGCA